MAACESAAAGGARPEPVTSVLLKHPRHATRRRRRPATNVSEIRPKEPRPPSEDVAGRVRVSAEQAQALTGRKGERGRGGGSQRGRGLCACGHRGEAGPGHAPRWCRQLGVAGGSESQRGPRRRQDGATTSHGGGIARSRTRKRALIRKAGVSPPYGADQPGPRPEKRILATGGHSVHASSFPARPPLAERTAQVPRKCRYSEGFSRKKGHKKHSGLEQCGQHLRRKPVPGKPQASRGQARGRVRDAPSQLLRLPPRPPSQQSRSFWRNCTLLGAEGPGELLPPQLGSLGAPTPRSFRNPGEPSC